MNIPRQDIITTNQQERILINKIRTLSPDKISEVVDFVDFLTHKNRDRHLLQASNRLAEDVFRKIWANPEDDEYDNL